MNCLREYLEINAACEVAVQARENAFAKTHRAPLIGVVIWIVAGLSPCDEDPHDAQA